MSVTFYAKDPIKSTRDRGVYIGAVHGPNWSNGSAAVFLELIGFSDRELWGGKATIAEAREAITSVGRSTIDDRLARGGAFSSYAEEFMRFLDAAERAGATEIYWA